MTALALPARVEEGPGARPVPWRRMAWVVWRQHRVALGGLAALLGALSLWLLVEGLQLRHAYAMIIACRPAASFACSNLASKVNGLSEFLRYGYVLQPVPVLIGAFVGAPVLARELETGAFRFAWAQGFGRWRWALAKLVALAVAVVIAAGAFGALISWYYQPYFAAGNQALGIAGLSPLGPGVFDLQGLALPAWTLVAFAIGGLAGMLLRRVVPAIVATLAASGGLVVATGLYLRQHYLAPVVTSNPGKWVSAGSAWVISQRWFKAGGPVSQATLGRALLGAPPSVAGKGGGVPRALASVQYVMAHGYTLRTTYQPAGRFWPFQFIEAGWLLALSLLLIAATSWFVRRRPS